MIHPVGPDRFVDHPDLSAVQKEAIDTIRRDSNFMYRDIITLLNHLSSQLPAPAEAKTAGKKAP